MIKHILIIAIIYVSIIALGFLLALVEEKFKAYKNRKWAVKFMNKVDKFQFK